MPPRRRVEARVVTADQHRHDGLLRVLLDRGGVFEPSQRELGQLRVGRSILVLGLVGVGLLALRQLRVDEDAPHAPLRRGDQRVLSTRGPRRAADVGVTLEPTQGLTLVLPPRARVLVVAFEPHLRRGHGRRGRRRQGLRRVLHQEHAPERRDDRGVAGVHRPAHHAASLVAGE